MEAKNLGKKLFHPWIQSRREGGRWDPSFRSKEANTRETRGGCHVRSRLFFDSSSTRSSYPYFSSSWKSSLKKLVNPSQPSSPLSSHPPWRGRAGGMNCKALRGTTIDTTMELCSCTWGNGAKREKHPPRSPASPKSSLPLSLFLSLSSVDGWWAFA